MTTFRFIPITPHPLLQPYVAKMSVFESGGRLPATDNKLIIPNAYLKLTLTCDNEFSAQMAGETFVQPENRLSLTGIVDTPVYLDALKDAVTATIVIELNTQGAYRLFRLSFADVKNRIVDLSEIIGPNLHHLLQELADTEDLLLKARLLQRFLIKQLAQTAQDLIFEYCVNRITGTNGLIGVAQLERETGYRSRWLHNKFSKHLGTGPKNLMEIVRFKHYYHAVASGADAHSLRTDIYRLYHDQSHFIRAFKRFTGFTPRGLENSRNELAVKHFSVGVPICTIPAESPNLILP